MFRPIYWPVLLSLVFLDISRKTRLYPTTSSTFSTTGTKCSGVPMPPHWWNRFFENLLFRNRPIDRPSFNLFFLFSIAICQSIVHRLLQPSCFLQFEVLVWTSFLPCFFDGGLFWLWPPFSEHSTAASIRPQPPFDHCLLLTRLLFRSPPTSIRPRPLFDRGLLFWSLPSFLIVALFFTAALIRPLPWFDRGLLFERSLPSTAASLRPRPFFRPWHSIDRGLHSTAAFCSTADFNRSRPSFWPRPSIDRGLHSIPASFRSWPSIDRGILFDRGLQSTAAFFSTAAFNRPWPSIDRGLHSTAAFNRSRPCFRPRPSFGLQSICFNAYPKLQINVSASGFLNWRHILTSLYKWLP